MLNYDAPLFRPPSEAYSLIIQVTLGCSHNKCTFCSAYKSKKFHIKSLKEIKSDLSKARSLYPHIEKIFLADGDALILPTPMLLEILQDIRDLFPECQRIGIYGSAKDINKKKPEELKALAKAGLGIVYMGLESGNEEILLKINKGVTAEESITAGQKIKKAGIPLSITIISGLGGKEKLEAHALDTAKALNLIDPDFLGLLTLLLVEGTEIYKQHKNGEFNLLSPREVMLETKLLLENLNLTNCVFRANHASNFFPLKGTLPRDKASLLTLINKVKNSSDNVFKKENQRLL